MGPPPLKGNRRLPEDVIELADPMQVGVLETIQDLGQVLRAGQHHQHPGWFQGMGSKGGQVRQQRKGVLWRGWKGDDRIDAFSIDQPVEVSHR